MSPSRPPASSPSPSPHDIDRREALRRAAMLLGGAISAPTLAAVLAGCDAHGAPAASTTRALDPAQSETIATIAEHIIPETDTPGARGAGVPRFIETMLAGYYTPEQRARFLDGLADVDARARSQFGRPFLRCSNAQQHSVVAALDAETFGSVASRGAVPGAAAATEASKETERGGGGAQLAGPAASAASPVGPAGPAPRKQAAAQPGFFRTMKELTVIGYYTSQPGATKELRYVQVPGRFEGCVPLAKIGRAWAV